MSTTKPIPSQFAAHDGGERLGDWEFVRQAILNQNSANATYGIVAVGTTQATATALAAVYNQVDTTPASSGVTLPLSTGKHTVPCQTAFVFNNGANTLTVYPQNGSSDTVNGGASVTVGVGVVAQFVTIKGGAWVTADVASAGAFTTITASGNITETLVGSGFVQKFSATGAGRAGTFTLNGATTVTVTNTTVATSDFIGISLNTIAGTLGTVSPRVLFIQPGVAFAVAGVASDTSLYNYTMIGIN